MANFSAMLPIDTIQERYGHHMAVLIEACRVHFGTSTLAALNTLLERPETNYAEIALHSRLHRIRPVIFRILLQANCPEDFKARIKTELHSITLSNFSIAKETERIIQGLAKIGVTAIPYKGVAFSKQFYGDISMRESSDIDLIIDAADLEKTFPFFEGDGFHAAMSMGEDYKNLGRAEFLHQNKDFCFDKIGKDGSPSFHVELHWEITHPRYLAPKFLNQFDRNVIESGNLINAKCQLLQTAEHVRAICLHHMVHDGIEYIKTLLDLGQGLKKNSELNQDDTASSASEKLALAKKMEAMNETYEIGAILQSIESLFGIQPHFRIETTTRTQEACVHIINYNLTSTVGRYQRHRMFSLINHYRRTVKNRILFIKDRSLQQTFIKHYWLNVVSPQQAEKEFIKLPGFLHFLYFIIRPIRIALRKKSDA